MFIEPIVKQIAATLPRLTSFFSSNSQIVSFSTSGNLATIELTKEHGLSVGDEITVSNVKTPVQIDSFQNLGGNNWEAITVQDHDLTLNAIDGIIEIQLTGNGYNPSYNELFVLTSVLNRKTFTFKAEAFNPPAGNIYLQQSFLYAYNGLKQVVSVPSPIKLTYEINQADLLNPFMAGAVVSYCHRISSAINPEIANRAYTKQSDGDLWLFVTPLDASPNKSRENLNDGITTQARQADFMQKVIDGFNLYIFVPNKGEIITDSNGRAAWDLIQMLKPSILRSVVGIDFQSGLAAQGQNVTVYNGDGQFDYLDSYYIHEFSFQQVLEITEKDTAIQVDDRAFRDVCLLLNNQFSEDSEYTALLNLDEKPLE